MCNPNSAIASRRYRLNRGAANHLLTQKLMGSLINIETQKPAENNATAPPSTSDSEATNAKRAPELSYTSPAIYTAPYSGYFADSEQPQKVQPSFFYQEPAPQSTILKTETAPVATKPKSKRRRKPQKPGFTAKGATRHFVEHHYHDHAMDPDDDISSDETYNRRRGGVTVSFPLKLHTVLEQVEADGFSHVISWQPHGRCFVIHKPKEFTETVMPRYFRQSKLTSFQRQLNLYGYQRIARGSDSGGYYHELFLRGKPNLCKRMVRTKVKGTKFKAASSPDQEPNFYAMPPVVVTPHNSDCDNSDAGTMHGSYYDTSSSSPTTMEQQAFQPPRDVFEPLSPGQPQEASLCPIEFNQLAMQTFGNVPSPPQLSEPYVPSSVAATAPSIPSASSAEFMEQAVDELFLEDSQSVTDVMDFVASWDNDFEGMGPVTSDLELGNLLDKILED